jgi:hypothetical protein
MFINRYVVRKAEGVGGMPIPEDEPCLVIRGQDRLAPTMLRIYLDCYTCNPIHDHAVVVELENHLHELVEWQWNNSDKVKEADR